MDKESKLKGFLKDQVNPIFERLVVALLIDNPPNIIDYSIKWLDDTGRKIQNGEYVKRPKSKTAARPQIAVNETPNYDFNPRLDDEQPVESDEENEEEQYDEDDFEAHYQKSKGVTLRQSVSAEAVGKYNQKKEYIPRVIAKSEEQINRIRARLMQSFMFSELDEKDREIVVNSMEEKKLAVGETVIQQGDDGDVLYLVDQGELDCYRKMSKGAQDTHLKVYYPGEAFGELALLYNAPRAATIKAKTESVVFSLDRECFNNIVKEGNVKKRERYEEVLKKVDLLASMDPYERTHLCDGLKEQKVKAGETVIQEGDQGDRFYMVDEGELQAFKVLKAGEEPTSVMSYKQGDYFGELALIRDIPRQATVKATTDSVLVYLDFKTFKRLMGPMEALLKRNEDKYAKYWNSKDTLEEIEKNQFAK